MHRYARLILDASALAIFSTGLPNVSAKTVPPAPLHRRANKDHRVAVPAGATIGLFTVGVSTIEQMTSILGEGLHITGGHPHGARLWISKETGWGIYADGFDYGEDGRVIDSISITLDDGNPNDEDPNIPRVSMKRQGMLLFGTLGLGTTYADTVKLLKSKGIHASRLAHNKLHWIEQGRVHVNRQTLYTTWEIVLSFAGDKLDNISIDATSKPPKWSAYVTENILR